MQRRQRRGQPQRDGRHSQYDKKEKKKKKKTRTKEGVATAAPLASTTTPSQHTTGQDTRRRCRRERKTNTNKEAPTARSLVWQPAPPPRARHQITPKNYVRRASHATPRHASSPLPSPRHLESRDGDEYPRVGRDVVQIQLSDDLVLAHVRLQVNLVRQHQQRGRRQLLVLE